MKIHTQLLGRGCFYLLLSALCFSAAAQGTTFTYQGRLNDTANPANGSYDLQFALHDAASGGTQQGVALTNSATAVSNGLFTVTLDFGDQFPGAARWLDIAVRTNGGGTFTTLSPRQALTATPYAITAGNVTGPVSAAQVSGILSSGNLPGSPTFGGTVTATSFTGSGASVTDVNAASLNGLNASNFWQLGGNNVLAGQFLGSTNNQTVELRANNQTGLRLINNGSNAVNVVGGWFGNSIAPGTVGAVIAGGGAGDNYGLQYTNQIGGASSFSVIGGGIINSIQSPGSVIGGGQGNSIQSNAYNSVIAGGAWHTIKTNSREGTIVGGYRHVIGVDSPISTIVGGSQNEVGTNVFGAAIVGGQFNSVRSSASYSAIGGGDNNEVMERGHASVIGGGEFNQVSTNAETAVIAGGKYNLIGVSATNATIGGGRVNYASGSFAAIPGGYQNLATNHAFAAGTRARAVHPGAFVWKDSTGGSFASVTNDEFAVRAAGGVRFVTSDGGVSLNGEPLLTAGSTNILNLTNPANIFTGNFTGSGAGLTNLNAWQLGGNAGTTAGTHFLGTTDNQPMEIKVNGERALRLEPAVSLSPNIIGGSASNAMASSVFGATIAGGAFNVINAGETYTLIGGGVYNWIGGSPGLLVLPAPGQCNSIGGGGGNYIQTNSIAGTIAGGANNAIQNNTSAGTIAGGMNNLIGSNSFNGTIAGGRFNSASGEGATVGGGVFNAVIQAAVATVAGGYSNAASGYGAAVGGGQNNIAEGLYSTVGGGIRNTAIADRSTIGGGSANGIHDLSTYSTVAGGLDNQITTNCLYSSIAGGLANSIHGTTNANNSGSAIGGGSHNTIQIGADGSTIEGGGYNVAYAERSAIGGGLQNSIGSESDYSTVGGGAYNIINSNSFNAVIAGGWSSTIGANSTGSTISGGQNNDIGSGSTYATVGGGYQNDIAGSADYATVGGGDNNNIGESAWYSTIAGGFNNQLQNNTDYGSIGGGSVNIVSSNSQNATIAGGQFNTVGANGDFSTIGGGYNNDILPSAQYATIPGGADNAAADYAFAAGHQAKATNTGAFVWADSSAFDFSSTNDNSFSARAVGGVRFVSAIDLSGNPTAGVELASGGGAWTTLSDRHSKENFEPVDALAVLERVVALPVSRWNYKTQAKTVRHIGPTAQDFAAAFAVGETTTGIATVDADGVALAAIQGLNQKIESGKQKAESELAALRAENAVLRRELAELRKLIGTLAGELDGGAK